MLRSKGKVYSATGSGKSLYKSFVVVVSKTWIMFERKKQAMDSKCHSSMPEEGSYMYIGFVS